MEAADESEPSALEEEAPVHKATEDLVFLKRFIPQNVGEDLNPGQEVERLDHRAEGNLRLGVFGPERVHTAPKDGVNETVSEEGEEKARRMVRGMSTQQLRETVATTIERRGRCAIYSIILVITEQTGQERKRAVKEAAQEKRKNENAQGKEEEKYQGAMRRQIRMAVPIRGLSYCL